MDLADWMNDGKCRGIATDVWYPPLDAPNPNDYYAVAREVCHRCSVWEECLSTSIKNVEKYGMWGGLSPQERNTNRQSALKPHGTITRFRQGCSCKKCALASKTPIADIDLSVYPRRGEPVLIEDLKYKVMFKNAT